MLIHVLISYGPHAVAGSCKMDYGLEAGPFVGVGLEGWIYEHLPLIMSVSTTINTLNSMKMSSEP